MRHVKCTQKAFQNISRGKQTEPTSKNKLQYGNQIWQVYSKSHALLHTRSPDHLTGSAFAWTLPPTPSIDSIFPSANAWRQSCGSPYESFVKACSMQITMTSSILFVSFCVVRDLYLAVVMTTDYTADFISNAEPINVCRWRVVIEHWRNFI
jgi:hypothetical protein